MTNEYQNCLNLQKRFSIIVCNLCNIKGFEQPLIYLQDDVGNKIVSLKALEKVSFEIDN
jgi:hypothetical protein